jgi:hypothetical protein
MYYLSYSADGDHSHSSAEPEPGDPTAPLTPDPGGVRAAVLPARDPLANSSQLGAGKVNLQVSRFAERTAAMTNILRASSTLVSLSTWVSLASINRHMTIAVTLQFSEDCRWAFSRTPEQAARSKVDWNVCFSSERCDQYGNTPTTVPEELLAKAQGINLEKMRAQNLKAQTIPAGLDRFTYW